MIREREHNRKRGEGSPTEQSGFKVHDWRNFGPQAKTFKVALGVKLKWQGVERLLPKEERR